MDQFQEAGPDVHRAGQEKIAHQPRTGHADPGGGHQKHGQQGNAPARQRAHPSRPRQWITRRSAARSSTARLTPSRPRMMMPRMIRSLRRKVLAEITIQPNPSVAASNSAATTVENA